MKSPVNLKHPDRAASILYNPLRLHLEIKHNINNNALLQQPELALKGIGFHLPVKLVNNRSQNGKWLISHYQLYLASAMKHMRQARPEDVASTEGKAPVSRIVCSRIVVVAVAVMKRIVILDLLPPERKNR